MKYFLLALVLSFLGTNINSYADSIVDGNGSVIYAPTASTGLMDAGATYPKVIELKNNSTSEGTLIATFDQGKMVNNRLVWPIYKSYNKGKDWTKVTDFTNGLPQYSLQMNPFLYHVPKYNPN